MKKPMIIFILISQFWFVYSSISNIYMHMATSIVEMEMNWVLQNKVKFNNLEKKVDHNISYIKPKLLDLVNNYKFNSEKNLKLFNEKNLIIMHLEIVQEQINSFKLGFIQTKEENMWEIIKLNIVYDFSENLKIIEDFLIRNEEKTKIFLSNPDNCESKLLYKKYIEEVDFKKFQDAFIEINDDMFYLKDLLNYDSDMKKSMVLNKINILRKVNNIRKNPKQNESEIIEFNFEKFEVENFIIFSESKKEDFERLYEDRKGMFSSVQNIKLTLDGELKVKFDKLIEIMNKLENISETIEKSLEESNNKKTENVISKIDLYKKLVDEFLNSLNAFFSLFIDKSIKFSPNSKDFGTSIVLLMFKTILYKEEDIKSNVDYVFKTLLGIEEFNDVDIEKLKTHWLKNDIYNSFKVLNSLLKIIDPFCEFNDFILSEKNESKFKEVLSEDLNNKLKKFYDMLELFSDYLNTEDRDIRKTMNLKIFQKIFQFMNTDKYNNEYRMFQDTIDDSHNHHYRNSDFERLLMVLHTKLKYENAEITILHNFEKYEIIFLNIIFVILKEFSTEFLKHKTNILDILKNDPNMDISLKKLKDIIPDLSNLH